MENINVLKIIYENIKDPILICDPDYNVIWINSFAIQHLEDVDVDKNVKDIFPIYDFEKISNSLSLGHSCDTEKMGFEFTSIYLNFTPIIEDKLLFILISIKSRDDHFNAPFSLQVNKVISSVAEQFRSPLFSVFNLLAPISRKLEEYELYDDLEYVKHITKNCYRMIRSTVNLSEYFKLTNIDSYKLNFKRVNINKFIIDLCKSVQIIFTSTDITLEYNITNENIITSIDVDKFSIAFFNIISNSCTYTNPGSVIKICLEKINNDVVITFFDNGVGIEPENINRVFDPYFSHNPSMSVSYHGVGLGLSIVRRIVKAHKGSYILNSIYNKGTTLALKLPIDDSLNDSPCLESNMANYIANKFSPLYIYLADMCDFNVF